MRLGRHELDPQTLGGHIPQLYRGAWGLCGSHEEAEDLVQETFARVLSKPRLLTTDNELNYLLRALRNTFLSNRRTASRRPQTEAWPDWLDFVEDGRRGGRDPPQLELTELYAAISTLPPDFRDVLVAIDMLGFSYREAAHALRVREATITTRLHRARNRVAHSAG
jgi:RNA polymerase sigma-70 factor (ECF subfamily)